MSNLANYTFYSYLRRGLGNQITEVDLLGKDPEPNAKPNAGRPKINIQSTLTGTTPEGAKTSIALDKDFPIVSCGDILGFNPDLVIRTEPARGSTNFPSNYLAHIEFYDEDLPWRYTPAAPNGLRLSPWIFLLVLKEDEFTPLAQQDTSASNLDVDPTTLLPRIQLKSSTPPPFQTETWAWAHVHETNASTLAIDGNSPDRLISRLISPRKLETKTAYAAFVVPSFETGRLAGLGMPENEIKTIRAQQPASWLDPRGIPVYYEWRFHTGEAVDFEYLASLLVPHPTDPMVGRRLVDFSTPGFGMPGPPGVHDHWSNCVHFIEGALISAESPSLADTIAPPTGSGIPTTPPRTPLNLTEFSQTMASLINQPPDSGDPVVTIPFYGHKHILQSKLLLNSDDWLHQLNREPRYRAAAGLGAEIIRKYQEDYMGRAWAQLESIVAANKTILAAIAAMNATQALFEKWISPLPTEALLSITAPLHKKILIPDPAGENSEVSVSHAYRQSCYSQAMMDTAFRRIVRRRGPLVKRLEAKADPDKRMDLNKLWRFNRKNREKYQPDLSLADIEGIVKIDTRPIKFVDKRLGLAWNKLSANLPTKGISSPPCEDTIGPEDIISPVRASIMPFKTFPALLDKLFQMPVPGYFDQPEQIVPALAYPDFADPMFEKLRETSLDWLIPNLKLLPQNSVTMLLANQAFIEAFMVGLNVEMGSEMLWREYPTDERGSFFRQFWDVKGAQPKDGTEDPDKLVEKMKHAENMKDITPINTWTTQQQAGKSNKLGAHHNQLSEDDPSDPRVVLAVRGDLLKCFPNTSVYAAKAKVVSDTLELVLPLETKTPIFKAEVAGDITFLGFDLRKSEVISNGPSHPGWFFVFQETPGETRFGMDINYGKTDGTPDTWDDLAWDRFGVQQPAYIGISPEPQLFNNLERISHGWMGNAAQMAYILYQKPVMVAIHADKMLLPPPP